MARVPEVVGERSRNYSERTGYREPRLSPKFSFMGDISCVSGPHNRGCTASRRVRAKS